MKVVVIENLSHPGNPRIKLIKGFIGERDDLIRDLGGVNYDFAVKEGWIKEIQEENPTKAFCSQCKLLKVHNAPDELPVLISINDGPATPKNCDCEAQQNISETTVVSWYQEEQRKNYLKNPARINIHNDCSWFEKKEEPVNQKHPGLLRETGPGDGFIGTTPVNPAGDSFVGTTKDHKGNPQTWQFYKGDGTHQTNNEKPRERPRRDDEFIGVQAGKNVQCSRPNV